jgi:N-succinyldiaminopimelate aminotransferase
LSDDVYGSLVAEANKRRGPIYALNVGDTYLEPMPVARAEAQASAGRSRLYNYAPVQGEPALLDAIIARIRRSRGIELERDALQVMSGATGGFTVCCTALLEPGDEVVVLAPFWPLIRGIVRSRSAKAIELPFYDRLGDPGFDAEAALEAAITPHTVALYVNSPNNPTGRMLPKAVEDAIVRVVTRHELWLLADEAYEDLWYRDRPEPVWARADVRARTIACHTLSKSYAIAGSRIGFTHGPPEVMRAIRGVQTFLTYCAPRPLQMGAARALDEGDGWLEEVRDTYRRTAECAAATLGLPAPEGGTFLFFDAAPFFQPGEDMHGFLRRCLDAGVLLTPGSASGSDYQSWARLCFTAVAPAELDDALARLAPLLGR